MIPYGTLKKAMESFYEDRCTVRARSGTKVNPDTLETEPAEAVIYRDCPCRLSFGEAEVTDGDLIDTGKQKAKLFTPPDILIPPGSRITVHRADRALDYGFSAIPAVYKSHCEYELTAWKGYL